MDAGFLAGQFDVALGYEEYVGTGTKEQQRRWGQVYGVAGLTEGQRRLIESFRRSMKVLVISGLWCGDCVEQCPLLQRIAEANARCIELRFADRDKHRDLASRCRVNGGERVPVVLFMAEDMELCGVYGDRSLSRYRALAAKQLGAACSTGLSSVPADELAETLQDWLDEFERIQLMLQLSPRLRQLHND